MSLERELHKQSKIKIGKVGLVLVVILCLSDIIVTSMHYVQILLTGARLSAPFIPPRKVLNNRVVSGQNISLM